MAEKNLFATKTKQLFKFEIKSRVDMQLIKEWEINEKYFNPINWISILLS